MATHRIMVTRTKSLGKISTKCKKTSQYFTQRHKILQKRAISEKTLIFIIM